MADELESHLRTRTYVFAVTTRVVVQRTSRIRMKRMLVTLLMVTACMAASVGSTTSFGEPRLIIEGVELGWPSWSPDGLEIAIDVRAQQLIARVPTAGGDREIIGRGAYLNDPAWSSSGNIAYIDKKDEERFLVVRRPGGGIAKYGVGTSGELAERPWDPSGFRLAFITEAVLGYIDTRTGETTSVPRESLRSSIGMMRWSNDGDSVYGMTANGLARISFVPYKMELVVRNARAPYATDSFGGIWTKSDRGDGVVHHSPEGRLTEYSFGGDVRCIDANPAFEEIAVCVRGSGVFQLDAISGEKIQVTRGDADYLARWAPDGRSIAFVRSIHGERADLYVVSRVEE